MRILSRLWHSASWVNLYRIHLDSILLHCLVPSSTRCDRDLTVASLIFACFIIFLLKDAFFSLIGFHSRSYDMIGRINYICISRERCFVYIKACFLTAWASIRMAYMEAWNDMDLDFFLSLRSWYTHHDTIPLCVAYIIWLKFSWFLLRCDTSLRWKWRSSIYLFDPRMQGLCWSFMIPWFFTSKKDTWPSSICRSCRGG